MFSGIRSRPLFLGLLPGLILAGLVIVAGGYYSVRGIMDGDIQQFLGNGQFLSSLWFSLRVAAISTISSLISGTILALWLWKQPTAFPGQLYTIPLIFPHIVAAFFVIVFFSQSGIISSLFYNMRLIEDIPDFPALVFDNRGTGIILAYIYKETAFVVLLVLASLRQIPSGFIQTASMLGASGLKTLRTIILPHLSPTLWVSAIIIFLYSFGAYDIPYLIGSSSRPMVSIEAYRLFFDGSIAQRPTASLLLFAIWCISLIFLIFFILIRGLLTDKRKTRLWI